MASKDNDNLQKPGQSKTKKELVLEAKTRTLAQEIDNDVSKFDAALKRPKQLKDQGLADNILKQEQASADVLKRVMLIAATCDLQIQTKDGEFISAARNPLPLASYLAHGGRINVIGASQELMNWIATGDPAQDGRSYVQTQQGAIDEGKIVYNRSAATHNIERKEQKDDYGQAKVNEEGNKQYEYIEKKGFLIGAKSFMENKILGEKTNHFGVDLAMNVDEKGYDPEGKQVTRPDGDHGHLYINYKEEKGDKKGTMLLGVEGAAPSSSKHSKTGAPDPLSAAGSGKWQDVEDKQEKAAAGTQYKNSLVPKAFGSARIEMTPEKEETLFSLNSTKYPNLAKTYPATNADEFLQNYTKKNFHKLAPAVPPGPITAAPGLPKKTAAFSKEITSILVKNNIPPLVMKAVTTAVKASNSSKKVIREAGKSMKGKMEAVKEAGKSMKGKMKAVKEAAQTIKGKMEDVRKAARKKSKEIKNSAIGALRANKVLKSNKKLLSPNPEQNTGNTKSR